MANPCCKDCKHWNQMIRSEQGECFDKAKIIFAKYGDRKFEPPITNPTDSCVNWDSKKGG